MEDAGEYAVRVYNEYGEVTSTTQVNILFEAPSFTAPPTDQQVRQCIRGCIHIFTLTRVRVRPYELFERVKRVQVERSLSLVQVQTLVIQWPLQIKNSAKIMWNTLSVLLKFTTLLHRSARTHRLDVPRVRLATIGDQTFRAAGSRLWNSLPSEVVDCQTVDTFRRRLKHFFFNVSFSWH